MLENIINSVTQAQLHKQNAVFKHIAQICDEHGAGLLQKHIDTLCEISASLVKTAEPLVVAECAKRYAALDHISLQLAQALCHSPITIARPVLERSTVLDSQSLLSIIETQTVDHRTAIAMRNDLTNEITDKLISFDEEPVYVSLLKNEKAPLSNNSFSHLTRMSRKNIKIAEALGHRGDMPAEIAIDAVKQLPQASGMRLVGKIEAEQGIDITQTTANTLARKQESSFLPQNRELLNQLRDGVSDSQTVFRKLIHEQRLEDLVQVLAGLLHVPEKVVRKAIFSRSNTHTALLCRAAQMPALIYRRLSIARLQHHRLPESGANTLVDQFVSLTEENSREAVKRLRNALST